MEKCNAKRRVVRNDKAIDAALVDAFRSAIPERDGSFCDFEGEVLAAANELARRVLEAELAAVSKRFGEEVVVDGDLYRRHQSGVRQYHSLCGKLEVKRHSYRQVGVRNGPTVIPLEIEAGIIENATPALAFSVTQGFAQGPLRQYEDEMVAAHRVIPSRSTLERVAKGVGESLSNAIPVIEPIVRRSEAMPANANSISIGIDRTTVPMAELAELPRRKRSHPYVRRPPEPITVAFRMAYVATFAVHDRDGETLVSKRFAASAEEGPAEMLNQLADEVHHVRQQRPDLPLVIIQDGAPELWKLTDRWLEQNDLEASKQMIDRYHVDERLAQLAQAIAVDDHTARELYIGWRLQLDRSETAIDRICRRLNELAVHQVCGSTDGDPRPPYWEFRARHRFSGEQSAIAWGNSEYLDRHRSHIRYAEARRQGLPIGSGVTEGACKSVVTARFKRSGQRWRERGVSVCLKVRALHLNERLEPSFDLLITARKAALRAA